MARRQSFFSGVLEGIQTGIQIRRQQQMDQQAQEERELRMRGLKRQDEEATARQSAVEQIRNAGKVSLLTEQTPGDDGEMVERFSVGGQQLDNRAEAEVALRKANTPVAVARRQYEAAQASGVPELQMQFGNIYNNVRETALKDMQSGFREAMAKGVDGVIEHYNKNVLDGRQLRRVPVEGGFAVAEFVGGKMVGQPRVFRDQEGMPGERQFIAAEVQRFHASPDAYLESYYKDRDFQAGERRFQTQFDENRRQFDERMRAQQAEAAANERYRSAALGIQREGVGLQREQAARGTNIPFVTPDGKFGITEYVPGTRDKPGVLRQLTPQGSTSPYTEGVPRGFKQPTPDPFAGLGARPSQPNLVPEINEESLRRLDALINQRFAPTGN